jgi:hypothetical protein
MRKNLVLVLALISLVALLPAIPQTPPIFSVNAKYVGYGAGGGTANAQAVTYTPATTAYGNGQMVSWLPSVANTSAATLNIDGIGAHSLVKAGGAALVSGDLTTTAKAFAVYNSTGTRFELQNPQTATAGASVTSIATTSPITGGTITSTGTIACASCTTTIASGTSTMGTGGISSATCASAVTTSATGVATTDAIIVTVNADPTAVTGYVPLTTGSLYIWPYPTSNNVNFKVCNNTSATITPSAITLNWRVVR